MLEDSAYVRAVLIDFTKAFDIADHTVLMSELAALQLPGNIYSSVSSAKLLGVYIQENFNCDMHFKHIITVSSQRLHILKTLKRQGLSLELLQCVFHAIILSKMLYAISAWYGFLNKSHVSQINSLFKRAFKYGYVKTVSSLLVITYKVMDMVCRLVLLNLNFYGQIIPV